MSAIRFLAVISGFARRRTAFAALPLLFACASLISGCSGGGGGGGGGGVRAGGGNASISQPSPASRGNSALVVVSNSGIAGARSTLTLQANVDGDNGTGVNWVVAQCTTAGCSQPVTDGSVGTITTHTASGATATYIAPTSVLPSASFVGIFAKQPGTPGQPDGPYSKGFGVLPVPTPNALVTGTFTVNAAGGFNFVFRVRGFTANGLTYAMIGRFHLDGIGSPTPADGSGITAGLMDVNIAQPDGSSKTWLVTSAAA